jgi:DNA repair ATPase RecN
MPTVLIEEIGKSVEFPEGTPPQTVQTAIRGYLSERNQQRGVGERLARVADRVQVLVVTHSPQVAARGARHFRVAKQVKGQRAETRVEILDQAERYEELARMLAGEKVTEAARAAARSLLGDRA